MSLRPFHLAIPVSCIDLAKDFMALNLVLSKEDLMIIGLIIIFLAIS